MKKISKSLAKKKAWKTFSEYIRHKECERNLDSEIGTCVTCSKLLPYNQTQAGHFIGGRLNSVLFVEDNVHIQCVGCNVFLRGNYDKYLLYMLDNYGESRVRELANLKQTSLKYTIQDYLEIEKDYKLKLQELI